MVNIQGACRNLPFPYAGRVREGRMLLSLRQNHLPPKAMILPFEHLLRGQPSWPQKTVAGKKAAILMTTAFPLFKLHSSNSHLSHLLP